MSFCVEGFPDVSEVLPLTYRLAGFLFRATVATFFPKAILRATSRLWSFAFFLATDIFIARRGMAAVNREMSQQRGMRYVYRKHLAHEPKQLKSFTQHDSVVRTECPVTNATHRSACHLSADGRYLVQSKPIMRTRDKDARAMEGYVNGIRAELASESTSKGKRQG